MPKLAASGIKGLYKVHNDKCGNRKYPEECGCSWRGRYKGQNKKLADWAGVEVDPRDKENAEIVFRRFQASIDGKKFDPRGEHKSLGSEELFTTLIDEYVEKYVDMKGLDGEGLASKKNMMTQFNLIQTKEMAGVCLGKQQLLWIAGNPSRIEDWLNAMEEERGWCAKTWNDWHQKLNGICKWICKQEVHGVPRMSVNPMSKITRRTTRDYSEPNPDAVTHGRIPPDIEKRLFDACETLNEPRGQARKLTQAKADAIRQAVEDGAWQKDVAKKFKVSPSVVSAIVAGVIWTGKAHPQTANKGNEMRRRLIGGIDGGLRAKEMCKTQVKHVDWRGVMQDGVKLLPIKLPPKVSKGGKTTGKVEVVFASIDRFVKMLEARREQLGRKPEAYLFGFEDGTYQAGFRRQYRNLYDAAGLVHGRDYGRDLCLTWHTTRHEYASTVSDENHGNEKKIMALTRIKDAKTARRYVHTYDSEVLKAAVNMRNKK